VLIAKCFLSALPFFELTPASVKLIYFRLRFVHFLIGDQEARAVTGNGRIFELQALGLQQFLSRRDALFDAGVLARFQI
jgi:hypothetical protein